MATLAAGMVTLTDWAKTRDPDGKTALIAELLSETNEILTDMPWMEGNLPTGHKATVRTGIPTPTWRLFNEGVAPTKATSAQVTEQIGMLEDWSEVDADLADLNGDVAAFRLSEARAHLEGMNQEFAATLFYGAASAPEEFIGLAPRFGAIAGANSGQNVLNAGGTGSDNSSIWLIVWSPETICGIFPKGSVAGLFHEDLGRQVVEVTAAVAGNRMMAYRDRWQWKGGICVKDWRYAVRIANIDISNLGGGSEADLQEQMMKATFRVPSLTYGRAAWYMNRTCAQWLAVQRRDDVITGGGLTYDVVDGKRIPFFMGIPIRICDQLTETEAQVT